MSRTSRRGRASAARDPMDRFHGEWLGMVRPIDGLVMPSLSAAALTPCAAACSSATAFSLGV